MRMREYDVSELSDMPTLESSHTQDLKVDDGDFRVWLDRTGEDRPVQYEIDINGRTYDVYPKYDVNGDLYGWLLEE